MWRRSRSIAVVVLWKAFGIPRWVLVKVSPSLVQMMWLRFSFAHRSLLCTSFHVRRLPSISRGLIVGYTRDSAGV